MNLARPQSGQRKPSSGGRHFTTRGWLTPGLVGLLSVALVFAAFERGHGNLHKLKTKVDPQPPAEILPTGPGGQDPVRLSRSATTIGRGAELISATFLPGRGMNVFQITALIPGHGEVPLLVSPQLAMANGILNGQEDDANGAGSTTLGGAILAPWAQRLSGSSTATPGVLGTDWNGRRLSFPAENAGSNMSVEGLLLNRGADSVKSDVLPDGQSVTAVFHAGDFSGNWPSTVEVTVQAQLTAHDLDLTVTAKNTGQQPAPFGIGWHPFFAIPSGNRADALLTIPSQTIMEVNHQSGIPTGRMTSVAGTAEDFYHSGGTKLGTTPISATYTNLISGVGTGPVAELTDPAYNLKMSLIPLTPDITSMKVISPAEKAWVTIEPNTNLDDPFGPEWDNPENAGMITLAPGAVIRWKVRLEISQLGAVGSGLD
ncbi:MAG: aldose 1-epimerase [Acidobacteriaceae bacterium]